MKIAIGSDHAGFRAKAALVRVLTREGHRVLDLGPATDARTDYPDHAAAVARAVTARRAARGILVCGTGIGMGIAANKVRGIRAAVVWSDESARLASAHNGANVLCLSGRLFRPARLAGFVRTWLRTPFEGGRHRRRLAKIARMEGRP